MFAVELESALALALEASPSAQIKVLSSLCKRLESEEHWVEAGEAACAAAVVCMRLWHPWHQRPLRGQQKMPSSCEMHFWTRS